MADYVGLYHHHNGFIGILDRKNLGDTLRKLGNEHYAVPLGSEEAKQIRSDLLALELKKAKVQKLSMPHPCEGCDRSPLTIKQRARLSSGMIDGYIRENLRECARTCSYRR